MVIGLHGKMGAGKNEAARRIAILSPPVVEVSFAAKLKESAAAVLGCTVDDLERWKNDPHWTVTVEGWEPIDGGRPIGGGYQTIRSFLQRYGTEAHRDIFGADFWIDAALPLGRDYSDALYVVTDVRFPNEAARVRELGGYVIGIVGPNTNTGDHVSETELGCDYWVDNRTRDDNFATLDRELTRSRAWVGMAA